MERVEDVKHWLLEYERWRDEWVDLFQALSTVALDFDLRTEDDKLAILNQGCKHHSILKTIYFKDVDCSFQLTHSE